MNQALALLALFRVEQLDYLQLRQVTDVRSAAHVRVHVSHLDHPHRTGNVFRKASCVGLNIERKNSRETLVESIDN